MSEPVPFWLAFASIAIMGVSVVVLVFAIVNLVKTIKQNRVTRWTILRAQVYNNRALKSQEELARSLEALEDWYREKDE